MSPRLTVEDFADEDDALPLQVSILRHALKALVPFLPRVDQYRHFEMVAEQGDERRD